MKFLASALLLLGAGILGGGCSADPDPRDVAEIFWQGVLQRDPDAVRAASDLPAGAPIALLDDNLRPLDVSCGEAAIQDRAATVATKLQLTRETPLSFTANTYLTHDGKRWRVAYGRTFEQFQAQLNLALAVENFEQFGDALSTGIEQGLKALEHGLPVVEQQVENIGRVLRERLPALRQQLEDFSRRLDEALQAPPSPPAEPQPAEQEAEDAVAI